MVAAQTTYLIIALPWRTQILFSTVSSTQLISDVSKKKRDADATPTPKKEDKEIPEGIQEFFEGMATKTRSCETIQNVCVSVSVWIRVVDISVETKERTRFEGGKTLDTLERSQDERDMYGFD